MNYILDGHNAIECGDVLKWADWIEAADRTVRRTDLKHQGMVSTVFLATDYSFGDGPPILFETMVFDGPLADKMERYRTWEEAEAGHERMVACVKIRELDQ